MKAAFLTTADPEIGLGHLYRCEALAQALTLNGVIVELLIDSESGFDWLSQKSIHTNWKICGWKKDPGLFSSRLNDCDIPIFDAYDIDDSIWQVVRDAERQCVVFDDFGEKPELPGILINGSPGALCVNYKEQWHRTLLLGPQYQVLRPVFWEKVERSIRFQVKEIAIMLGGTDSFNLVQEIVSEVIANVPAGTVVNLIGNYQQHFVHNSIKKLGFVNALILKKILTTVDLLISPAGQTLSEAVSTYLPTIMLQTVKNQSINYRGWSEVYPVAIPVNALDGELDRHSFLSAIRKCKSYETRLELSSECKKIDLFKSTNNLSKAIGDHFECIATR